MGQGIQFGCPVFFFVLEEMSAETFFPHFGRMVSLISDMKPLFFRTALLLALPAAVLSGVSAQSSTPAPGQGMPGLTVNELHPKPMPTPFPLDRKTGRVQALEFRSPEQMLAKDRELAEASQGEIARRAGLQGIGVGRNGAGWDYEQAVCPVFPQHLILEYSSGNAQGDKTLFAAVIPRGEGHVRVIPVRRRGYSLFTPSSSNALTLNDFNHMVTEGHQGVAPDWLTLGLCYAALSGGNVRAALEAQTAAEENYPLFPPASLTVSNKGGAEVRFADSTPGTKSMTWVLTFAQDGRLLKVRHKPSYVLAERPVAGAAVDLEKPGNS
jgi:hypothetical protein